VSAHFLLGPAGSGKTFRCVQAIRAELLHSPDGPPLIFLAPKQATFQIERQLLSSDAGQPERLTGYTRLHILSFERLAAFVHARLEMTLPDTLTDEGRVMVLRALLARHHAELKVFRATARLTGFATQLAGLLQELQRSGASATTLDRLAAKVSVRGQLPDKLHDLALMWSRYEAWLQARREGGGNLDDASRLLDLAAIGLKEKTAAGQTLSLGGLWMDGFAEMTPQEVELLAALVPHCAQATLAFCLDGEPRKDASWLSPWTVVGETFLKCRAGVAHVLRAEPKIELLARDLDKGRFSASPELLQLERAWVGGVGPTNPAISADAASAVRLVACPNKEAEAILAARGIRHHVLAGGRYRECAVLVRSLDGYHELLRRVLRQYEIPFFLDRREPVAHHPLAELTRYALRTVAFDWRQEDWFGALKSGLADATDAEVDWLENEALKRGWEGQVWRQPLVLADDIALAQRLERLRERVVRPFLRLAEAVAAARFRPDGSGLAEVISQLWSDLGVEGRLEAWGESAQRLGLASAVHGTVLAQMQDWVASLERAFSDVPLPLREWLPILEAGFAGMTVGVVPPSLDQVLVGSIDRSRNPDLHKTFVLGVNEGVFPAPPQPAVLLTDSDRLELEAHGVVLGARMRHQLGHERYFGYIAFTRARQQLTVTWAETDEAGVPGNPSSFVGAIRAALPSAMIETYAGSDWSGACHSSELAGYVIDPERRVPELEALAQLPEFAAVIERQQRFTSALNRSNLASETAKRLYGNELRTSVSALEDFAACPFRFFAARGLRAEERVEFVVDSRQRGSFQHEVLQKFHEHVRSQGRQWRDVTPQEARQLIRAIGGKCALEFQNGLLQGDEMRRFAATTMIANLEELMATLVAWSGNYAFNPAEVEVSFGLEGAPLPAWTISLPDGRALKLRGRMDRLDVCRLEDGSALVVICDYKSSAREMDDAKIEAGIELQLLSYLAALAQMPEARAWLGAGQLTPAGVFYVPLRGKLNSAKMRTTENGGSSAAFQHRGRFDGGSLRCFNVRGDGNSGQFKFALKKDGSFAARGNEALPPPEFPELVRAAEARLRTLGERIYQGEAGVQPYRHKQQTACDLCHFRAACRFDPWTTNFRSLQCAEEGED
jgi:ATP-dependent helicase/nuclease subunit B